MDQDIRVLLEDSYHYTTRQPTGDGAQGVVGTGDVGGFEPFERFGDKEAIHDFLQNACEDYVTKYGSVSIRVSCHLVLFYSVSLLFKQII